MKGLNLETVEEIILGMIVEENERLRGHLYESNKQTEESCKNVLASAIARILNESGIVNKMFK